MTKSSSSRVKSKRDKTPPLKDRLINLSKSVAMSGVKLIIHVVLGIICIQQCRLAQSGILPTCSSTAPYTDKDIEMEQIHMDFLTTSVKGVDKSIKATFPLKDNLAIYQDSILLRTIRNWTIGANSSNMTYYLGTCMGSAAVTYYAIHNSMYGFINSWFPQWFIMYMSFTIIPIIFQLAAFCSFVVFVISAITNWGLLLELGEVTKEEPTKKKWTYDTGIWTWPSSPFTVLVILLVLCATPLICGAGIVVAIVLGLSVFLTKPELLYSKKSEIEKAMSSKASSEKVPDADSEPDADGTQTGGSDSSNTKNGDDTKKPTPEEMAEAKENACKLSNKTTSKKKEKFFLTDQIKLTFKVYRHIIMIIMTIYLLMDIYSTMGTQWLLSGIFAVIAMSYFTKVYHRYKITACDNFTADFIGYTNSQRKCDLIPEQAYKDEEAKRAGFPDILGKIAKMYSAMNPMSAAMGAMNPVGALAGAAESAAGNAASAATAGVAESANNTASAVSDGVSESADNAVSAITPKTEDN